MTIAKYDLMDLVIECVSRLTGNHKGAWRTPPKGGGQKWKDGWESGWNESCTQTLQQLLDALRCERYPECSGGVPSVNDNHSVSKKLCTIWGSDVVDGAPVSRQERYERMVQAVNAIVRDERLEQDRNEKRRQAVLSGVAHGKITRLYKAECERRGEDPKVVGRRVNAKTYRSSFADGYEHRISARLSEMRNAAATGGMAIALHGRKEAVDEAFYTFYPSRRPKPAVGMRERKGCEKCAKSKRGACSSHYTPMGRYRNQPYSPEGASAGRRAVDEADLGRAGTARIGS